MIVDIQTRRLRTTEQLRAFVEGNEAVDFRPRNRDEAYGFVQETLKRFGYRRLGKRDKSMVLRFLMAATGISRQQMERLVRQWRETGAVRDRRGGGRSRPFARKYAAVDIRLLAEVDEAYEQMSGLATREVLRLPVRGVRRRAVRAPRDDLERARLQPPGLGDLPRQAHRVVEDAAHDRGHRPAPGAGTRGPPGPRPRRYGACVDFVHVGDRDGVKGLYLINLVETDRLRSAVTQYEFVGADVGADVGISERFLVPLLEGLLLSFPFPILGFHADNASRRDAPAASTSTTASPHTRGRADQCGDGRNEESRMDMCRRGAGWPPVETWIRLGWTRGRCGSSASSIESAPWQRRSQWMRREGRIQPGAGCCSGCWCVSCSS